MHDDLEPDLIVIRFAEGTEVDPYSRAWWNGRWIDRSSLPPPEPGTEDGAVPDGYLFAEPTGRFEVRADGAVAEVFEVRS